MNSSRPPRMAPIQRLPFELKEQIARELCDFDLYDQSNYRIGPSGDTFLNAHTYGWKPLPEAGGKPQLSFQPVYDDLRALSLVSRNFRDPAQRALFSIVIVGEPTAYFKLLRSLLESPEVRRYIRCLFAIAVRNPDAEKQRHEIEGFRWSAFVEILCPMFIFKRCDTLENVHYFNWIRRQILPDGATCSLPSERKTYHALPSRQFPVLLSEVLHGVIQLCQSLRAFHLYSGNFASRLQQDPRAFWSLGGKCSQCMEVLKDEPLLTTLTIDLRAVKFFLLHGRTSFDRCPSTIHDLTIIGSATNEVDCTIIQMDNLFNWLSTVRNLKTLRVHNGFGMSTLFTARNLNDILLMFKFTLEQFVVDGTGSLLQMTPSIILGPWAYQQGDRCGPTHILSCLPEMEKLRYLSVPIHYLRRCPEGHEPLDILAVPNEGQEALQAVQADVTFPKSLKRAEVMVVDQVQDYIVTEVKSLRFELGYDGHPTEK